MSAVHHRDADERANAEVNTSEATCGLPLTGERTVPGLPAENYWFRRHEAAYEWLLPRVRGTVLEIGCGEGYGTALLAGAAEGVVGLDYDAAAVRHAAGRYPSARFVRGNLAALPVRGEAVDTLATLQVVEHVWDHPQFVRECRRVLRPGGLLAMTTPNRLTFSPDPDAPRNPFHSHEFTAAELVALLRAGGFTIAWLGGLHAGERLAALDEQFGGSFVRAQFASEAPGWSAALRDAVGSVRTADFPLLAARERDVDRSLDLVVLARKPD